MKRVTIKSVTKLLHFDEKNRRMSISQNLLNKVNIYLDLLNSVINDDKTYSSIQMETARRAKTEKTRLVTKYEGFAYYFLRLQERGTSWILYKT